MPRFGSLTAAVVALLAVTAVTSPGAVAGGERKADVNGTRAAATAVDALRARYQAREKAPKLSKRPRSGAVLDAARAEQFGARAATEASIERAAPGKYVVAAHPTVEPETSKGVSRAGTGGGDIAEVEPNDTTGQRVSDLPVNIDGTIGSTADVDCFAITVTEGEPIRAEVIADRIFASPLDSYLVALRDDGHTEIGNNDDGYVGSTDSLLDFVAPYTGTVFVCVTDATARGGSDYDYVLNITAARTPDVVEQEPNDSAANADPIALPGIAFGTIESGGYDVYTFQGTAGETLVLDVDADVFDSQLDALAGLYDSTFNQIVNDQAQGYLFSQDDEVGGRYSRDPRFNIVLPYTGTFYVIVTDVFKFGGSDFYYSLSLSTQSGAGAPRITGIKSKGAALKSVIGSGFDPAGAKAELNSDVINTSGPSPKKPTSQIRIKPAIEIFRGDVVTVINPDGRRSNPGIVP